MRQTNTGHDPVERLKRALNRVSRDRDFLATYVRELEHHRTEHDIFRMFPVFRIDSRLAFFHAGE
jgi:hypothetical protein